MRYDIFVSALLCLFAAAVSHATTRVNPKDVGVAEDAALHAYCEVLAKFLTETHVTESFSYQGKQYSETRVGWALEIQAKKTIGAAPCPAGNSFELSIRGAEFAVLDGPAGSYIYPPHIVPPVKNQTVLVHARKVHVKDSRSRKERDEWLVTDWEDGYEIISE